ncbi:guanine nucleotide exchange factor for Rab-3A-like isoform X2 [Mytilus trossulus]|uniref:guanine nucleotide exchange factor for Rab-3A-like isoform X2 n=1 Tax=Mytilus trossulus TaxID=6551 RepID=UPI003004CC80
MTSAVQPNHQSPPPINHNGELDMTLNNNVIEKVTQAVEKCKIDEVNTNTTNCNGDGSKSEPDDFNVDYDPTEVKRRTHPRGELRHAMSEILPNDFQFAAQRKRSQTMEIAKEHAYSRLQSELNKAQEELKLKDEECDKLLKVRDQMGEELEDLTASLFEEANNMVQDANIKRMHSEKILKEANEQIDVLQAELKALKQLVLTSTPSSPNKHLHPQIASKVEMRKKEESKKPFWKTHRRSTSHHEFTKEAREGAIAEQDAKTDRCKEIDQVCFDEFCAWRQTPLMERKDGYLSRVYMEDILPCLNFANTKLSQRVQECVGNNSLAIEPIPGDNSYPRKCRLTENNKLCNYKIRLGDEPEWYSISQLCRNRIAAVCDYYTYIRYIQQGLVKNEDKEVFYELVRLRKKMALTRLGYS